MQRLIPANGGNTNDVGVLGKETVEDQEEVVMAWIDIEDNGELVHCWCGHLGIGVVNDGIGRWGWG